MYELWRLDPLQADMGPSKLADFGKVRDFSQYPCVITLEGVIACHDSNVGIGAPNPEGRMRMIPARFASPISR
jgi:hypothetical protein